MAKVLQKSGIQQHPSGPSNQADFDKAENTLVQNNHRPWAIECLNAVDVLARFPDKGRAAAAAFAFLQKGFADSLLEDTGAKNLAEQLTQILIAGDFSKDPAALAVITKTGKISLSKLLMTRAAEMSPHAESRLSGPINQFPTYDEFATGDPPSENHPGVRRAEWLMQFSPQLFKEENLRSLITYVLSKDGFANDTGLTWGGGFYEGQATLAKGFLTRVVCDPKGREILTELFETASESGRNFIYRAAATLPEVSSMKRMVENAPSFDVASFATVVSAAIDQEQLFVDAGCSDYLAAGLVEKEESNLRLGSKKTLDQSLKCLKTLRSGKTTRKFLEKLFLDATADPEIAKVLKDHIGKVFPPSRDMRERAVSLLTPTVPEVVFQFLWIRRYRDRQKPPLQEDLADCAVTVLQSDPDRHQVFAKALGATLFADVPWLASGLTRQRMLLMTHSISPKDKKEQSVRIRCERELLSLSEKDTLSLLDKCTRELGGPCPPTLRMAFVEKVWSVAKGNDQWIVKARVTAWADELRKSPDAVVILEKVLQIAPGDRFGLLSGTLFELKKNGLISSVRDFIVDSLKKVTRTGPTPPYVRHLMDALS